MAIPTLTDDQIRTWTREQKDRWWLENVFRGGMPQLTLRAAVTGFVLGGLLSATNLYVGAKTGWTLGVGLTSVILAFSMFFVLGKLQSIGGWLARLMVFFPVGLVFGPAGMIAGRNLLPDANAGWYGLGLGLVLAAGASVLIIPKRRPPEFSILENNLTQSVATAAGYMTGPLISGMAAYMWVMNEPMVWWKMLAFNVVLSFLGVLVAFPMKRRFINDEQQPFPEGKACGVVLDTLYTSAAAVGLFKARALAIAASLAGFISFVSGEAYMKLIQVNWLGLKSSWHLPHNLDAWYYNLAAKGIVPIPRLSGVDIRQLGLSPTLDLAMVGAGGLMGIRSAMSMMVGMLLNFVVIVPMMIAAGEIVPKSGSVEAGTAVFGRVHILNTWALWWGIVMMVASAMIALFAKPQVFVEAFRGLAAAVRGEKAPGQDVLAHIELPLWISWLGIPIVGAAGVWMAHDWFGVSWVFGATAIPMIIVLTLIAASATGMTGITPTGALSKIPQFTFGAADPKHPPTNLMTGVMCVEVATNASNLLMDIKPGYMLGGKPRHQAIGHCIGILAGAIASTPLFYALFLSGYDAQKAAADKTHVQSVMVTDQFSFPSALQWKGVSELVTSIFGGGSGTLLTDSIIWSMVIACAAAVILEVTRLASRGKFPISPLAIGLGVVVPPESTLCMFAGALFFWWMHKLYGEKKESRGNLLWVQTHEPICAGIIAGAALVGIGDVLVKVFVLK